MGVCERYYKVFIGEDPVETYHLRRRAVLYDVPEKPWQIEGPDAMAFLDRIFARKVSTLKKGRGSMPLPAPMTAARSWTASCSG